MTLCPVDQGLGEFSFMPNARPGAFVTGASANSAREELSSGAAPSLFEMAEVAQTAEGGRGGSLFVSTNPPQSKPKSRETQDHHLKLAPWAAPT